ncbi:hypothetical protein V9K67_17400 [Paraflavisolibacter sp. H34]|uniref:hypothetical protein n=1 Tax=Huijunlia imazamoxiresistens TaxID=3127457 RepID=UPI00301A90C1
MMNKHYIGRFVLATEKDIQAHPQYADVNVYRYVVKMNFGSGGTYVRTYSGPADAGHGPSWVTYSDQVIYDRKENKTLPATGLVGHNFAQGMMYFAKAARKI